MTYALSWLPNDHLTFRVETRGNPSRTDGRSASSLRNFYNAVVAYRLEFNNSEQGADLSERLVQASTCIGEKKALPTFHGGRAEDHQLTTIFNHASRLVETGVARSLSIIWWLFMIPVWSQEKS